MSKEELDALGEEFVDLIEQDTSVEQDDNVEQDLEQDDPLEGLSPAEKRAWNDGWRPLDQFDGNPDNWKTAEAYNLYGEMQKEIHSAKSETRRKEAEFEARIANLNKLHEQQQKAAIEALKAQQREAVYNADPDEYDRLQKQIDDHQTVIEPVQTKDPDIAEWESRNEWINDPNNEKALEAKALWNVAASKPNATVKSALAYVDAQLAKLYPDEKPTNTRREMPSNTEQSIRTTQRRGRDLTMNDLTHDERNQWAQFGKAMFGDEKSFLKAVADARKQ